MLLADTLAVGAAGGAAPGAEGVLAAARRMGAGKEAPVLGTAERLPAPAAAFVNGFRIHALEWDAVHEGAVVHAMSVVTAAVHAVAHREQRSAEEAFLALAVGVEVACRLGLAATGPMRFFRPAVAGLYGAALAAARLVPEARAEAALGLAHAQAAGTMQAHVEGSPALALQIAHAARAAVTAADLAAAGLDGPRDPLEGPFGHFSLFETGRAEAAADALGSRWHLADISVKPWPCGRASHGTLSVLAGRPAGSVGRVEARLPPLAFRLVARPWREDMTPAWARLCLPFLSALMLAEGRIDPRRFTAETFRDRALHALGRRIEAVAEPHPDPNALYPQTILLDGTAHEVRAALGSPEAPLAPAALREKLALALSLAPGPVADADGLLAAPAAQLAGTPA